MEKAESKRTVRTFALASFLNDMGSDMIYPVWPLFVTSLGANMAVLGFLDGLGDSLVAISQAASGYLSDKLRKRKIFIWLGYLFGALSRVGYALSPTWHMLIPFRALDRAGKIRNPPRDAIIADVSHYANRGGHFGILRAMDNLGAVCGILVTIALIEYLGYRHLFLIAAIPSVLAAVLILSRVREREDTATVYKGMRLADLTSNFRLFLFLNSVFALGAFSYSFLLIFAGKFGFKTVTIPVLYLTFTAFAFLSSIPFGRLSDRFGRKSIMMVSFALWGLVCLDLVLLQNTASIWLAFVLFGLHRGALDTVQKVFVSELVPEAYRASGLGGFQMVIGLVALPSSVIAGLLWDNIGLLAPFYFSLALSAVSIIMLFFVRERPE